MSEHTKGIVVAVIGALSATAVAWITAGGIARSKVTQALDDATSRIGNLTAQVATLETDMAAVRNACPQGITKQSFDRVRTFNRAIEGQAQQVVELVNVTGSGCLLGGSVLGYYFLNSPGGINYTVNMVIDGVQHQFPTQPASSSLGIHAYTQDAAGENSGVLVLPSVRFFESLRIEFIYSGGGKEVSSYALVLMDR